MKKVIIFIAITLLCITSCNNLSSLFDEEDLEDNVQLFQPKYADMPKLDNPAKAFEGTYTGKAYMRMDLARPLRAYDGTFKIIPGDENKPDEKGKIQLHAEIKPGKMPFYVHYDLKEPSSLIHEDAGYKVTGHFKVDVPVKDGTKKPVNVKDFWFDLGNRSHIVVDENGDYWLRLYYKDNEMLDGRIIPGALFFAGKLQK